MKNMSYKEEQELNKEIDKRVERHCNNCKFNFGSVCASHGVRLDNGESTYGMSMEDAIKMFPKGCEEFTISLEEYIAIAEQIEKEVMMN